jgi:phosphoglucosamine mutase
VKLDDAIEDEIESQLDVLSDLPTGAAVGRIRSDHGLVEKYVEHLVASIDISLAGLTVVVDAANGAASAVSPEALRRAGANVIAIHCEPTGYNINAGCGSTHIESLQSAVREHGAAAGIAHDGDADRCLAIDENGEIVDGDQILAIIAAGRKNAGTLVNNTVVATVMSNLGFNIAMQQAGIEVVATAVGDRYVLEAMREHGHTIGGEQSGHLILAEYATTGDGTLTALALLAQLAQSGVPMSELASIVTRLPQVLINVRGVDKALVGRPELTASVEQVEARLSGNGRVLLRPSGTEPVIRVMVEASTEELAQSYAQEIADLVAGYCSFDASS